MPTPVIAAKEPMMGLRLTDAFLEPYRDAAPDWGFGVLGWVVYQRTYSRPMDDGQNERWWQTVRRVVEGVYFYQHEHCRKNGLPWNPQKAQASAQKMYDLIFNFKFLPPGRGLWAMGTQYVRERGSAALNNCFSGDTRFLTKRSGAVALADAVGETLDVLCPDGQFRRGQVSAFGEQQLDEVVLVPHGIRTNHRLRLRVTADHRWLLSSGSVTTALEVGDVIPSAAPHTNAHSDTGYAHGLIYGDGTRHTYYPERHIIRLCGRKNSAYNRGILEAMDGYVSTRPVAGSDDVVVTVRRPGENWKDLPTNTSPEYLASFIRGWLEADAGQKPSGSWQLDLSGEETVQWVIDHAPYAGLFVTGHTVYTEATNFGERSQPLHRLSLSHAAAFRVVEIHKAVATETVYCVTEPETHAFTLAGGVVTGNCAFVTTQDLRLDFSYPFTFLMDMSMLGVGVGGDTRGAGTVEIKEPSVSEEVHTIADSREGWVESVRVLLDAFAGRGKLPSSFDYSAVRPAGSALRGFGGVASGPAPLKELHDALRAVLSASAGKPVTSTTIVDVFNLIGKCVVAGGIRRSAEIMLGSATDEDFIRLKDPNLHSVALRSHRWASNNSLFADVGMDYHRFADQIMANGEPGFFWMENARRYRRMKDQPGEWDPYVMGQNPCGEISLESGEFCNLVEVYPARHESWEDLQTTLKWAYLFAKTVSLIPTHNPNTNAVIGRNRRLGVSVSGVAQAIQKFGPRRFFGLLDKGYEYLRHIDNVYSKWLCVPQSIKLTTVKPSGTISLLTGATPGVHFPHAEFYVRNVRFDPWSPLLPILKAAGYPVEPSEAEDGTQVVSFPVHERHFHKAKRDVSVWEQFELAAQMQHWWADNSVSVTVTVRPEEARELPRVLSLYETRLKSVSILPLDDHSYRQAPYIETTPEAFAEMAGKIQPVDWAAAMGKPVHDVEEAGCTNDSCSII